jgi:hypothetical protein
MSEIPNMRVRLAAQMVESASRCAHLPKPHSLIQALRMLTFLILDTEGVSEHETLLRLGWK